jgi:hypothetical protein
MKSATLPSLVSFFGESVGDVIKPQPAVAALVLVDLNLQFI